VSEVDIRVPFKVKMRYELHKEVPIPPYPNFHFKDERGEYAFVTNSIPRNGSGTSPGIYQAECNIPGCLLNNGTYFIGLALTFTHQGLHISFNVTDALAVNVSDPIEETLETMRSGYSGTIPGVVRPQLDWVIEKVA
jgi:lipopolysaccharide transport system ATP-binding protein